MTRIVIERPVDFNPTIEIEQEAFDDNIFDINLKFDSYELSYENWASAGSVSLKDNGREVFELQNHHNFLLMINITENPAIYKNQKFKGSIDSYYKIDIIARSDLQNPSDHCGCSKCDWTDRSRDFNYEVQAVTGIYSFVFGRSGRQIEKHREVKPKEISNDIKEELK